MAAALPAHLLERLPALVRRGEPSNFEGEAQPGLSTGVPDLDALLPDGGFPRGAVVELALSGGAALGTSLSLSVCRAAQEEAVRHGGDAPWCAFVDPTGTLHGPGVASLGVRLDRLLVARPPLEALERTAIRLVESRAFAVVVVDAAGVPGSALDVGLGGFPRVVRRLSLASEGTGASILLLTELEARRPLPLPVAMRLELTRTSSERLVVRVAKERRGRVSGPRAIAWSRARAKPLTLPPERKQATR